MTNEELVVRIKNGIDVANNMLALWQKNRGIIHMIAKHYQSMAEIEDLEQEGYLALYTAVDGYNADSGYKFLTYAKHWIRQYIMRYVQNNSTTVRIPVNEREKLQRYRKIVNTYRIHHGRKPTRHEIACNMGISDKAIIDIEKAAQMAELRNLDSLIAVDDESTTVGDMVSDDVDIETDVLEDVQREHLKAVLWPLVDALPEQQGQVLRQRYQENRTLKETGESIGITIERVRQIEHKAMRGLRCSRNARLLRSFLMDERVYSMGLNSVSVGCFNRTWTSSTERAAMYLVDR